ncbi:glycosyltransferase [Gammaproteobacteria bacterium]|nr:glycosyltransferase [Gammaproteobacteria bacterium]
MNNFISVIMPTFNREVLLKRAIDSVLMQSITSFELLIVDNFSTDNTEEMISSYNDRRILYFKNRNNGVIANSRNYGIKLAKGNYVAFLDSDDWWEPNKLEKSLSKLNKFDADLVYHDCYIRGKDINKKTHCRQLDNPAYYDLVLNGNTLVTSSVVIKKESFKDIYFSESTLKAGWEDYDLWIKLAKKGLKFLHINQPLANYWMGEDNFDNPERVLINISAMEESIFEDFKLEMDKKPWWPNYTQGIAHSNLLQRRESIKNFSKVLFLSSPFLFKLKAFVKILREISRINH